jgi:histidinol-phosphate aminotransferase
VAGERERLLEAVRGLGLDVSPSQANVLWLAAPGVGGAELAHRLERHGVLVAPGGPLGDDARVRVSIHRRASGDRLLRALELSRPASR